jgi:N4-gp56 family major capsid protein
LAKKKGDMQTFGLRTRLKGNGVTGDNELEGNEEKMLTYSESVAIDQIRHAVRLSGKLDDQKVTYDQIEEGREGLRVWMTEFLAHQIMHKLGGVTNPTLVDTEGELVSANCAWSNTPDYIPDADENAGVGNRYLCANAGGTTALTAANIMTLDLVTKIKTKAKLSNPRIQPIVIDGQKFYVLYLHPLQVRDIKLSSDWKTAQQNAQARSAKNPVFTGVLGEWDGVLLVENEYTPWLDVSAAGRSFRGAATGTVCAVDAARALLCGRQAVVMAEASNPKALVVKRFDYENKDGVAISFIGGLQKAMFNSKEFGVIALDTAAKV